MTSPGIERRSFLRSTALAAGTLALGRSVRAADAPARPAGPRYEISLAAWSLHKLFFDQKITQLDMVRMCREDFGIGAFEMVNTMWPSPTYDYCKSLKQLADGVNVKLLLIMCDREGDMSHPDKKERLRAARNHHKWVDLAAVLGCHSIRCNTGSGKPGDKDTIQRAAESFSALVAYAKASGINVLIENHGGMSSDAESLVALMKAVGDPHFGTLPDFGNFPPQVDKYEAIERMMPYAKAVSAKCFDFDDSTGLETKIDFPRMLKIVTDAGYRGYVGIEFEGSRLNEPTGILRAKTLLQKLAG